MRVVAGSARGVRLLCPRGKSVRPPSDRVKEAVFSILGHDMGGLRVLDLFAGSGMFGIEALSRGAAHAAFVESDPTAIRYLRRNLGHARVAERSLVVRGNALQPRRLLHGQETFDLVFIDPPYRLLQSPEGAESVVLLFSELISGDLVSKEAVFVLHRGPGSIALEPEHVRRTDSRTYGTTVIDFLRVEGIASVNREEAD